jgi:hypothetical protein
MRPSPTSGPAASSATRNLPGDDVVIVFCRLGARDRARLSAVIQVVFSATFIRCSPPIAAIICIRQIGVFA